MIAHAHIVFLCLMIWRTRPFYAQGCDPKHVASSGRYEASPEILTQPEFDFVSSSSLATTLACFAAWMRARRSSCHGGDQAGAERSAGEARRVLPLPCSKAPAISRFRGPRFRRRRRVASSRGGVTRWIQFIVCQVVAGIASAGPKERVPLVKRGALAWENARSSPVLGLEEGGTTRLLAHAVADSSAREYLKPVRAFLEFAQESQLSLGSLPQIDKALAKRLDELCYVQNRGVSEGSKLVSGWLSVYPEHKGHLPLTMRSILSWMRLQTGEEGGPLPDFTIAAMGLQLIENGEIDAAIAAWLQEDTYGREQDWEGLCSEDILVDERTQRCALLLGNTARGETVKTGGNQGVTVDAPWLAAIMMQIKRRLPGPQPVFPMSQSCFRRKWWQAGRDLHIEEILKPPHALRHSRPSRDVLLASRTLEEIRRRGRWVSLKSVQRYTKTFMLVKEMGRTPEGIRARGQAFLAAPEATLLSAVQSSPGASSFIGQCILEALAVPAGRAEPAEEASVSARATTPEVLKIGGRLSAMNINELRKMCSQKGFKTTGRKAQLIERLAGPPSPPASQDQG